MNSDLILILAVFVTGFGAAISGETLFWLFTPAMGALILLASRQRTATHSLSLENVSTLPSALARTVEQTLDALPQGQARTLLLELVHQATAAFGGADPTFDKSAEQATRDSVRELVEGSCQIATDLARLATAIPATRTSGEVREHAVASAELLAKRLNDASASVAALVASSMEGGTPASDRVDELVRDIKADASARRDAKEELKQTLS